MFERVLTEGDFEKVYPILAQSFPESELRAKEDQLALLQNERYRLYAIKDEKEKTGGVIAAWELPDDLLYVDHFAILPEKRNHGFGGEVLDVFLKWKKKKVVLEVELPEDAITRRRIGFYKRHGFAWNDYPYMQPPMRKGQKPFALRLMTKPAALDAETYEQYRSSIHQMVYGYTGEDLGRLNK
ncbi:GNAT family N-acetyltransferase [Anaerotignum sp.]|uniref:GNAT family N-acetyltransferase n=1 Tax=Anaerotignum sp. TaxID=2039241 RepID=UPI002A91298B|nr:GNAT family N-acetyltransferase [Anaerotignum sp.]MCI7657259.1 GNAT family N-acetyltransferase [Clostridia bacterium]MDY5415482.1 GNAT family N-acetyltransferase [Anaerotignum sp.]